MKATTHEPKRLLPSTVKSPAQVVTAIRNEAAKNPVLNAVCHVFAIRERARQQVTLSTLRITMSREGYNHTTEQLQEVLKFFGDLGLGKIERNSKGAIVALKGIKSTLQSIGLAGISKKDALDKFEPSHAFKALTPDLQRPNRVAAAAAPTKKAPAELPSELKVSLTVDLNGTPVTFNAPTGIAPAELCLMLSQMFSKK